MRSKKRNPDPQFLDDLLQEGDIFLKPHELKKLWQFHQLLRKANQDRDLTRITGFESMVIKHYIDCLLVGQFVDPFPDRLVDIGTGAGFPGIPLKIIKPDTHIILAEPRPKRVRFLKTACQQLKLKKVGIFSHKVTSESFQEKVNGVVTRAFEDLNQTLKRMKDQISSNGLAIFMKGPAVDEELVSFQKNTELSTLFQLKEDHAYTLPRIEHARRLLVFEKVT